MLLCHMYSLMNPAIYLQGEEESVTEADKLQAMEIDVRNSLLTQYLHLRIVLWLISTNCKYSRL